MGGRTNTTLGRIRRIANGFSTVERKLVFEHQGVKLHASEIHFMQAVVDGPKLNLTGLAKKLGITKGAASQTLARLQKKGMIGTESDPYKNQLQMEPTRSGQAAMRSFQQRFHKEWQALSGYLDELDSRDHQTVSRFLTELEAFLRGMA